MSYMPGRRENDMNGACLGKKQYSTYWSAKRSARALSRYRDTTSNPYKCPHCKSFHVGTTLGHQRRRTPSRHTLKGIASRGA